MIKIHNWINTGLIILVAVLVLVGGNQSDQLGAATRFPHGYLDTADGYYVDGTAIIDGSGNVDGTITSGSITLDGADTINEFDCVSNTAFNPGPVSATTTVTATTSVPGAALGDIAFATLSTSTTGLIINAEVTEAAVITVTLSQSDADNGAPVDLATTTLKNCYIGF